jgi:hypothetical protein
VFLPRDTLDPLAVKNGLMLLATIKFPTLIQFASFFSENCMIPLQKLLSATLVYVVVENVQKRSGKLGIYRLQICSRQ